MHDANKRPDLKKAQLDQDYQPATAAEISAAVTYDSSHWGFSPHPLQYAGRQHEY
jgi:hypothetical protein